MATKHKPPQGISPLAEWIDKDGRPTKQFFDLIAALLAWAKEADAELN